MSKEKFMKSDEFTKKVVIESFESDSNNIAIKMLKQNLNLSLVSSVTGMSLEDVLKLKNKIQIAS
jgi:hypothetical protein